MLNSVCNLDCPYCYGPNADDRIKLDLSLDNIYIVIDFLYKEGVESIVIAGGEPLLHPNIIEIVEYIYAYDIKIALQTNITRIDILKKVILKISWIGIPVDAISDDVNKILRTDEKYYTYILKAIQLVKDYRDNNNLKIKIGTVLTPYNINDNEINKIAHFINKIQPDLWKLYQVRPRGRAKNYYSSLYVSEKKIKKIEKKIRDDYPNLNLFTSFSYDSTKAYCIIDPDSMLLVPQLDNYIECGKLLENNIINKKNWEEMQKIISYDNYTQNIYKTFNNFKLYN